MNIEDIKVGAVNTASLLISFSSLEDTLKLLLLITSIIYTIQRIAKQAKDWNND